MSREELKAAAVAMLDRAYCPYSHFAVGAALECGDGTVFTGCNIENAAYSPTICAERAAAAEAVKNGFTHFETIAVCGGKDGGGPVPGFLRTLCRLPSGAAGVRPQHRGHLPQRQG